MFGKKVVSLASATALASALALTVTSPSMAASGKTAKPTRSNSVYIVRMADAPAVAYDGKIKGYAATRPAKGGKIDLDDANVGRYVAHLSAKHDSMLQKAGGGRKLYSYGYAFKDRKSVV